MTERPILFNGPMVRALLAGQKTQTRRIVKPQPVRDGDMWGHAALAGLFAEHVFGACMVKIAPCPYGQPGDRLWVRETWQIVKDSSAPPKIWYRADPGVEDCVARSLVGWPGWRPAIHMPRAACRLELEVTAVRVERLMDISIIDAAAEGIPQTAGEATKLGIFDNTQQPGHEWDNKTSVENYFALWDSLNAKRGFGWDVNPWVWVLTFKRIEEARKAA